jgi:hypothetical protein
MLYVLRQYLASMEALLDYEEGCISAYLRYLKYRTVQCFQIIFVFQVLSNEEVTGAGSSVRQSLITNQNNQLYSVRSALSLHPSSSDIYLGYTPSGIYGVH